jgi:N-methylhydantoinase A
VKRSEVLTQSDIKEIVSLFHDMHHRIYAYGSVDEIVEFINLRVAAIGKVPEVSLAYSGATGGNAGIARKDTRPVHFPTEGFIDAAIYDRDLLRPGHVVTGPALIEEIASTTVITPGTEGTVDEFGSIIIPLS